MWWRLVLSLEEQVTLIASVESLVVNMKAKDEQITFMMEKITMLTGERSITSNQKQHLSFQEEGENWTKKVV